MDEIIEEFVNDVVANSGPNDVAYAIRITTEGYSVEIESKSSHWLRANSITMRNLKGDWITK